MAGVTLAEAFNDLHLWRRKTCVSISRGARNGRYPITWPRIVADQPGQGWSLLCNGVILFDDGGELLPDSQAVTPDRPGLAHHVAMAA